MRVADVHQLKQAIAEFSDCCELVSDYEVARQEEICTLRQELGQLQSTVKTLRSANYIEPLKAMKSLIEEAEKDSCLLLFGLRAGVEHGEALGHRLLEAEQELHRLRRTNKKEAFDHQRHLTYIQSSIVHECDRVHDVKEEVLAAVSYLRALPDNSSLLQDLQERLNASLQENDMLRVRVTGLTHRVASYESMLEDLEDEIVKAAEAVQVVNDLMARVEETCSKREEERRSQAAAMISRFQVNLHHHVSVLSDSHKVQEELESRLSQQAQRMEVYRDCFEQVATSLTHSDLSACFERDLKGLQQSLILLVWTIRLSLRYLEMLR